jgi:NADH dehydrogenase
MKEHLTTDILILGAGIGGFETFRTLSRLLRRAGINKTITIVDKNNYFTFVPMMHEVATGSIEPTHASIPLRELVYNTPHHFQKAEVQHIDPKKKCVTTSTGTISYTDACVVALGSRTNYFGTPGAEEHTYHVRTLEGAMRLKHDVLTLLDTSTSPELAITVVGGGYTGVEVAGQYTDLIEHEVRKLYPEKHITLRIIEASTSILAIMPPHIQKRVTQRLGSKEVEILVGDRVMSVTNNSVTLATAGTLHSDITIWTAGFETIGAHFLDSSVNERGRINVTNELLVENHDALYAIGDIANITDPHTNISYPQLAEAAHLEGEYVAHHIVNTLKKKHAKPFVFKSKGQMMPVGDWWGVAQIGPFTLFGKLAWWIRRTVYVLFMPGFLRKLRIVSDWTIHSFGYRDVINVEYTEKRSGRLSTAHDTQKSDIL